ncbi:hypothetical protein HETIRDRAFT_416598 [Heterobasidion irregulare TC 32-1]|uniref:DNA 3'-5' helicase n=1 Tax=Heterobasidion irregulare (strain TC 32-1) TaxID=747525 RepID=W4JR90_HETIT|nr:uncharacterized protein HETIRDRAFT_416598 [Heterobasidion irregulare TC 32-1]XP_009553001.1 uncharacterized protein HETIRDRAFT_423256 [Heterobasidion irregulare TC 32-1]ETW75605.1 hypothetical protein HETIRDRAFT_423256 [Heterobasidion irregulare TC 32-1]ETW82407.1 hypothetical protein HETIRDRAFT_416598 [Heterobasidion irregulare TC 32-1]
MQSRQNHLLAILPCGIGKTFMLLFQAKIYDYNKVTILLLPLSGLHADEQINIPSVTPNGSQTLPLLHYDLINQKQLARVVFDEAYKVLTDVNYRDVFHHVKILLQYLPCPFTFFCGCLPPTLEAAFWEFTGLEYLDIIRMPTAHPELAYAVYLLPKDQVFSELIRYVEERTTSYHIDDRAMVFCHSKANTQKVASALGVLAFFAESEKELRDANNTVFCKWVEGSQKIMVCTSILGCGVDLPCVRDVIHFDLPYTALDKHQQENCASRDGKPANAVTFVDSSRGALPD